MKGENKMLPIGSIVYLTGGDKKVMILNRGALVEQDGEQVLFDYTGGVYPNGLMPEQVYHFNEENIDKVVFVGFKDEDEERFQTLYEAWLAKQTNLKKGQITKEEGRGPLDA